MLSRSLGFNRSRRAQLLTSSSRPLVIQTSRQFLARPLWCSQTFWTAADWLRASSRVKTSAALSSAVRPFRSALHEHLWRSWVEIRGVVERRSHLLPYLLIVGVTTKVFFSVFYSIKDLEDIKFMRQHFLASWEAVENGRLHTLLTYSLCHVSTDHLYSNLFFLFPGIKICKFVGCIPFMELCIGGALCSSLFSIFCRNYVKPFLKGAGKEEREKIKRVGMMGASGVAFAVLWYGICTLEPATKAYLGKYVIGYQALFSLYSFWERRRMTPDVTSPGIDYDGHLGGILGGHLIFKLHSMFRRSPIRLLC